MTQASSDDDEIDPKDFLRALLRISPEDAKKVRERSPVTRKRKPPEGPHHDYGEDDAEPS
jgi:hypothetical protein